jgi:enamine deaminase RidA (YjgF/YER057c/UK114 family)
MGVQYINPEGLPARGYSNVVVITGNVKTVYIGGQNAVDASGAVVGKGDLAAQVEQIFKNMQIALDAAGAKLEHVVKWNILVVQGQNIQPGFEVYQRIWGDRPNPPAITVAFVAGLAHLDFLCEMDAIAVVPE